MMMVRDADLEGLRREEWVIFCGTHFASSKWNGLEEIERKCTA